MSLSNYYTYTTKQSANTLISALGRGGEKQQNVFLPGVTSVKLSKRLQIIFPASTLFICMTSGYHVTSPLDVRPFSLPFAFQRWWFLLDWLGNLLSDYQPVPSKTGWGTGLGEHTDHCQRSPAFQSHLRCSGSSPPEDSFLSWVLLAHAMPLSPSCPLELFHNSLVRQEAWVIISRQGKTETHGDITSH